MDYKNLIGFLIIKELNQRQVRWVEMLIEYYFKIQYTKGIENIKVNALSKKAELQNSKKLLEAMLRQDKDKLIRYNYSKLTAIVELERVYKILESI